MSNQETVNLILAKVAEGSGLFRNLEDSIKEFLRWILKSVKEITGNVPTEEEFIKTLALLLDNAIDFKNVVKGIPGILLETVDDKIFLFILQAIDKTLLDKYLGPDWYTKLTKEIEEMK